MNDDVEVPAVLYHYTSNNAFLSILKSRELRLSALSQSNDSLEGKWLLHALKSECREQGINQDHRQQIADFAEYVFKWVMGYGFCLSSDRDQLSQWRGYADDGRGVAIGFKTNELLKLTNFASVSRGKTELKKVLYEVEEHRLHVAPIVKKLFEASRNLPLDDSLRLAFGADQDSVEKDHPVASIRSAILGAVGSMFQLKSTAFKEESEWRILSETFLLSENGKRAPTDDNLSFTSSGPRIIPHHVIKFPESSDDLISFVVLGPKNNTPWSIIDMACHAAGVPTHGIGNSMASYR